MATRHQNHFLLVSLVSPFTSHDEAEKDLIELKSLVQTFGGATIVHVIQRKMTPDSHTYVGTGKAQEIADFVKKDKIDTIVINSIVNPTQLFNLKKMYWDINNRIEVWDRIDLILHIFERHAHTTEAKLQIDLARMRHMGPRIYGMGLILSRQGGGIGTRGIGETNIELMKRHWRNEMKGIIEKLEKLTKHRERQMERRREIGFKTASIIGYTNAGKSTLFNRLTGKHKLAKDVLFATLESHVGKVFLPQSRKEIIVSDTIGFIQNLPAKLIDAFKSTLMETLHADVLLHIIDASDNLMHEKIAVVEEILSDLQIDRDRCIYVFNKVDASMLRDKRELIEVYSNYSPVFVSAKTGDGLSDLSEVIERRLML